MLRLRLKIMSFVVVVLALIIATSPAMAAVGETVQIGGNLGSNGVAEEGTAEFGAQLEITNVVSWGEPNVQINYVLEGELLWTLDEQSAAVTVNAPATIRNLEDAAIFKVFKLTKNGDAYDYDYSKPLNYSSGKVTVYGDETFEVDALELSEFAFELTYQADCTVVLTEVGQYYAVVNNAAIADNASVFIEVVEGEDNTPKIEPPTQVAVAKPTSSNIVVNEVSVAFQAYTIADNNYFKLRDLATVINGTAKQFEVIWDEQRKAIDLISNQPYTAVGGEMAESEGDEREAVLNNSPIYQDSNHVELAAYTIGSNNYFKLRDIAKAFDFGVAWDEATNTIAIDTDTGYVEQ